MMKSRNIVYTIVLMLSSMLFASCSEDTTKRIEFAKIVESRTSQDLLNDLYLGSDADIEAIARILNVTPSSVERIRKGESYPTVQFEERIYEVSLYYMQNGQSFSKLRAALDPEYAWYDYFMDAPSDRPWLFWGILLTLFLMTWLVSVAENIAILGSAGLIIEFLLYCVVWISCWICSPDNIQDSYVDTINPTIEQLK
jgi:transcriptional regulator with XRE-family HTH domain